MSQEISKTEARERMKKLIEEIEELRYRYHVLDDPKVDDAVYDSLERELFELEAKFPDLKSPDSPINRVAGKALDQFAKVNHQTPMLSLADAFDFAELETWEERNARFLGRDLEKSRKLLCRQGYFCELKIDGLAMSLVYQDGYLKTAATRGDGTVGEDVTQNVRTIEAVPLKLRQPVKGRVEIRGEVYMNIKNFERLNQQLVDKGEKAYANPRNLTAGSVRQLDPKITAQRPLRFFGYSLLSDQSVKTHEEEHCLISSYGVPVEKHSRLCRDLEEVNQFLEEVRRLRGHLEYQIDGVVVTVNDAEVRQRLGAVGKAPRGSIAYKYAAKKATTVIEDIIVQIGRTGALTPVAVLRPVNVGGVVVSRATLHNEDEINEKDLRIGDTVVVQRAGDVIPEILEPIKKLRPKGAKKFKFPTQIDGVKVIRPPGEAVHRLVDTSHLVATRRKIEHFASRGAMDIDGLGTKVVEQLVGQGLIKDAADLYRLSESDLEPLERFAEKSANKLVAAIAASKRRPLWRILYALGIRHVGAETARLMAEKLSSWSKTNNWAELVEAAKAKSVEDWCRIPGVGSVVAQSIYDYFHDGRSMEFVKKLIDAGIEVEKSALPIEEVNYYLHLPLQGKTVVITGMLESLSREEAEEAIRQAGGHPTSSVSAKTDFVVVGQNPGSKYDKALKLGVKILDDKEFMRILKKPL